MPPKAKKPKTKPKSKGKKAKAQTKAVVPRNKRGGGRRTSQGTALDVIRERASTYYQTSSNAPSLRDMAADPRFEGVTFQTLQRWCSKDGWVEKRKEFFDNIAEQVKASIGEKLVASRLDMLDTMTDIFQQCVDKFMVDIEVDEDGHVIKGPPPAKSFESLVTATVKLADYVDRTRQQIVAGIPGQLGGVSTEESLTPDLTTEEAKISATAILRHRREQIRAKIAEDTSKDESDG